MPSGSYERELGFGNMGPARVKELAAYSLGESAFTNSASAQAARVGSPCPIRSPYCLRGRRWWHRELLHPTGLQCDRYRCVLLSLTQCAVNACCPLTFRDCGLCFASIAESLATDSVPLGVVPSTGLSLHQESSGTAARRLLLAFARHPRRPYQFAWCI